MERYDADDEAGAARELRDNADVVVDTWEWDPIGRAYLDCLYGLENGRKDAEITPEQRAAVLAGDAARAARRTENRPESRHEAGSPPRRRRAPWSRRRRGLVAGGAAALVVLVVVTVQWVFRPDYPVVTQRLSDLYGAPVEWRHHGKYQRDDLIVDGRDIGDHCVVEGEWFGLDDLRITCDDPAYQPVRVK
jgi:hypothetical protein